MRLPSSFRDPSGFLFYSDGVLLRQVNRCYQEHYDHFITSGLYGKLIAQGLLISHSEENPKISPDKNAYKVIKPEMVTFISYPYEWCFTQLKMAALATLAAHKIALEHGMVLKDGSAYNIQFHYGNPLLIDTLSFEKYMEGQPWAAYRQFCQHFLAPLALMAHTDIRLQQLFRIHIDGIPLDLASRLLPWRTRFSSGLLMHLHLHAGSQKKYSMKTVDMQRVRVNKLSQFAIAESLANTIKALRWKAEGTEWGDYYSDTNYTKEGFSHKREVVARLIGQVHPATVWDLGANDGTFSRIAADKGCQVISFDIDPAAVEKNYQMVLKKSDRNILPLLMDLTNTSSGIGWANEERSSLAARGPADLIMALALIHHLAIGNNVPFDAVAEFLSKLGKHLIIEFVPKNDSQVRRLLVSRVDVFTDYNENMFVSSFVKHYELLDKTEIKQSGRSIYLFRRLNKE